MVRIGRLTLVVLVLVLLLPRAPARAQAPLLDPTRDALACAFHVARTVPPDRPPRLIGQYVAWEYLEVGREAEALEVTRLLGDAAFRADMLAMCGATAYREGDPRRAARWLAEATRQARRVRTPEGKYEAWCAIGQSYRLQDRPDVALRLLDSLCTGTDQQSCDQVTQLAQDLSDRLVLLGQTKRARELLDCIPLGWGFHYGELAVRLAESGYLDEALGVLASAPRLPGQRERERVLRAGVASLADRGQWTAALALADSLGAATVRGADAIAAVAAEADTAGHRALADSLYRAALDRLLTAKLGPLEGTMREELFGTLAMAFAQRQDFDRALTAARALPLRNDLDQNDRDTRAIVLGQIGVELRRAGEVDRSAAVLDEARELARGFPDDSLRCTLILARISQEFFTAGFPDLSRQYLGLALDWNRRLGPKQQGFALAEMAACPGDVRDDEVCSRLLVEALGAAAAITDLSDQSRVLADLGAVQIANHLQIGREGQRILRGIVRRRGPIWRPNLSE